MTLLSNSPGSDLPVVSVVIALFLLVTVYYGLLLFGLKMPVNKLLVSYSIIIILLITILLISRYYFTFFKTFESFIADYKHANTNKNINKHIDTPSHLKYTNNPFASIYDVDNMCQTSTQHKMDRNNIGWKCRVRNDFGHDALELKSNDNTKSSIKYKLKYDGIYDVEQV